MSLILKVTDAAFSDATLPLLRRDALLDAGTKFLYDFADPFCWSKQAAPASNDKFVNFVTETADATATLNFGSLGFSNGGLVFSGVNASPQEWVKLPAAGILPTSNQGFLFVTWIKHGTPYDATTIYPVSGYMFQTGSKAIYGLAAHNGNNNYRMYAGGTYNTMPYPAVGTVTQMASAWVKVNGVYVLRSYANGAQYGADNPNAMQQLVTLDPGSELDGPYLGTAGGFGYNWQGNIYRTFLTDIGATGADPLALVQKDWAENNGRFI